MENIRCIPKKFFLFIYGIQILSVKFVNKSDNLSFRDIHKNNVFFLFVATFKEKGDNFPFLFFSFFCFVLLIHNVAKIQGEKKKPGEKSTNQDSSG
jgi:hypothetical protein